MNVDGLGPFAWPLAFLIAVVVFLFLFKKDISTLIGRTRKISREGLETSQPQTQSTKERTSTEDSMRYFDSLILREQESIIKKKIENIQTKDQGEEIDILIRHLAATQIDLRLEGIYRNIWGSQIKLLHYLNSNSGGSSIETLKTFYDEAYKKYPEVYKNYSFQRYLKFLDSDNLIITKEERNFITTLGREFLGFLVKNGLTQERYL